MKRLLLLLGLFGAALIACENFSQLADDRCKENRGGVDCSSPGGGSGGNGGGEGGGVGGGAGGGVGGGTGGGGGGAEPDSGVDAGVDAGQDSGVPIPPECSFTYGGRLTAMDGGPLLAPDGGPFTARDLSWGAPRKVFTTNTGVSGGMGMRHPTLSHDRLTICFQTDDSSSTNLNIMCATRLNADAGFGTPQLAGVNSSSNDGWPELSPFGDKLYLWSDRNAATDRLYVGQAKDAGDFKAPLPLTIDGGVTYAQAPEYACLSRRLFFVSSDGIPHPAIFSGAVDDAGISDVTQEKGMDSSTVPIDFNRVTISPDGTVAIAALTDNTGTSPIIGINIYQPHPTNPHQWVLLRSGLTLPTDGGLNSEIRAVEFASDHSIWFAGKAVGGGGQLWLWTADPVVP